MRVLFILIVLTTIINLVIYLNRQKFSYIPYKSYSSLYKPSQPELNKWRGNKYDYNLQELAVAKKILRDSAFVNESDQAFIKAKKIYDYIHNKFSAQYGYPTQAFLQLSALDKYYALSNTSVKLWCGDFSDLFSFFSFSENLLTRNIELPGRHSFNEVYLPEKGGWQFVDLTDNVFSISKNGRILNAADVIKNESNEKVFIQRANTVVDTLIKKNLYLNKHYHFNDSLLFYYSTNLDEEYKFKNKVARYILPTSFNAVYQVKQKTNFPYYAKLFFLGLWGICILIIIYTFLNDRSKKYTQKL